MFNHIRVLEPSGNIATTVFLEIPGGAKHARLAKGISSPNLLKRTLFIYMENCFFYIDHSTESEDRKMSVICVDCEKTNKPEGAWFYDGIKNGFGPYDYKCCVCEKLVHTKNEYEEKLDTE